MLAVVVPFTSLMTSNLLRALQTLFGLKSSQSCSKIKSEYISMVTVYSGSRIIKKNKIQMGLPSP
ncbi:MAG: hypothetical protein CSA22_07645 [Deltaproteobacteria bacterium]|nr:MAG: hypothetical protein CSA22_07645 [Deltaproteobacteria bacterium]